MPYGTRTSIFRHPGSTAPFSFALRYYLLLPSLPVKCDTFITPTARGTHDLFEFVTVFFFAFIGSFSQNHFRLRVRIKRQVLPMGCGMSDNKDCHGRWRRDRSSNRTRIVTTKSRLLRSISRRCYIHPSTRTSTSPRTKKTNASVLHHSSAAARNASRSDAGGPFFHYPFPPLLQHSGTARLEARHDLY